MTPFIEKNWEYKEEQPCVVHHSRLKIVLVYLLFISFLTLISIRNPLPAIFIGLYCLLSSLMLYKSRRPILDHFAGFIENFIFREVGANHIFWKRGRVYDEKVDIKYNVNTQKLSEPNTCIPLFKIKHKKHAEGPSSQSAYIIYPSVRMSVYKSTKISQHYSYPPFSSASFCSSSTIRTKCQTY